MVEIRGKYTQMPILLFMKKLANQPNKWILLFLLNLSCLYSRYLKHFASLQDLSGSPPSLPNCAGVGCETA